MTRQEEIKQAGQNYAKEWNWDLSVLIGFYKGVEWADAHPDNGLGFEPKSLEECIEDATPTWKAVDVDAFLDELRGREPAGWISVEDELPPRNTFFNFCQFKKEHIEKFNLKDKELDTSISCLVACNGDLLGFSYYNYKERKWLDGSGEGITHWMPLPEPPRKEN